MIVKERNWEGQLYKELKDLIVHDLFDKIGVAISTKVKKEGYLSIDDEYYDKMSQKVDDYFCRLVSSENALSRLLPSRLKDANKFYIFATKNLPTGGTLLTFVALLSGKVEPCELQMVY